MAQRGGGGGGKRGGGGGGGGKKTARSQGYNYLRQFGYPSPRELRMEAQGLASASVPTVRQVSRPYQEQIRSTRDYLSAIQSVLADSQAGVNAGYDQGVQQSQAIDQAAQQRLAGLGLGADAGAAQAVTGALGDSQTQHLITDAATAKGAAAAMPGIAAGQSSQFAQVTRNKLLDALANRRDNLSQAFFQALQQVQAQGLAKAQFNQSQSQFQQNLAQQEAQFSQQMALQQAQFAYQKRADARSAALQSDQLMAQYGYDTKTGKFTNAGKLAQQTGLTLAQIDQQKSDGQAKALAAMQTGQGWKSTLNSLVTGGIDPRVAQIVVAGTYGNPPPLPDPPPKQVWDSSQKKNVTNPDYTTWQSTVRKIKSVTSQYLNQMTAAQWQRFMQGLETGSIPKGLKVRGPQRGTSGWQAPVPPPPGYVDPAIRDPYFYGP